MNNKAIRKTLFWLITSQFVFMMFMVFWLRINSNSFVWLMVPQNLEVLMVLTPAILLITSTIIVLLVKRIFNWWIFADLILAIIFGMSSAFVETIFVEFGTSLQYLLIISLILIYASYAGLFIWKEYVLNGGNI